VANVIPFRKPGPEDNDPGDARTDDAGHELAIIEPTSVLPAPADWRQVTLSRPTWSGTKLRLGRAWSILWRWAVWQTFVATPKRLSYCIKWLTLGLVYGVVDLARWTFAADERREDKVGSGKTRKGAAVRGGREADHLAWWRLGAVFVPPVFAWLVLWHYVVRDPLPSMEFLPDWAMYAWAVPYLIWAIVYGHGKDTKPYVPPAAPRQRTDATAVAMTDALRALAILKPEPKTTGGKMPGVVTQAAMPRPMGQALRTLWDLPADCGKSAADVIAVQERLAGAFATPLSQFVVRLGSHPSQFEILQFKTDPFAGPMPVHPLAEAPVWDVWDGLPFGVSVLGEVEVIGLVFTSTLIGARPRRGKSFAARSALAGAVLDPYVRFHVFNGKAGETWEGIKPICEDYVAGAHDEDIATVAQSLERLVREMKDQHARIRGSKLTRDQARDLSAGVPVRVVVVDEAQEYLSDPKHGPRIEAALVTLAKVGPSAGFSPYLITQRPDEKSFPTTLRAVLGVRYCLNVMSYHDSNVVLGPDMSKLGFDASKITHKGVGILRPDEDANGAPDSFEACRTVRTFLIGEDDTTPGGAEDWASICARGIALREELGTMPGQVIELAERVSVSDETLNATELWERLQRYAPEATPSKVTDHNSLGRHLAMKGLASASDGIRRGRSRASVERVLGLSVGRLAGVSDPSDLTEDLTDSDTDPDTSTDTH